MTDTNTQTATTKDEPKTVLNDMDSRRLFDTTADALAYLTDCQKTLSDFDSLPIVIAGQTDDGEFDPEVYNESMRVAVAVLTQRGEGAGSSTAKLIAVYPSPKLEAVLASATGKDWLVSIMEKELNHVAVRGLRKAEGDDEIAGARESMPVKLDDFTTSQRETSGGILETYNDLWQIIKKAMAAKSKAWQLRNLSKKELRKAMESQSYASATYSTLENRTDKAGNPASLFVIALTLGQALAKQEGKDSAIFDKWLATRNEKDIAAIEDDGDDFDLDSMVAELAKAEPTEAEPENDEAATASE